MPLSILVPMILIGLPVVIGLVWWVNKNKEQNDLEDELARSRFLLDFPNVKIVSVVISDDGKTAFLQLSETGNVGLVHQIGQNFLTRTIDRQTLESIERTDGTVVLKLRDFTLKKLIFTDASGKAHKLVTRLLPEENN